MPPLNYTFPDALKVDYGEPLGLCNETGVQTGRYVREWCAREISRPATTCMYSCSRIVVPTHTCLHSGASCRLIVVALTRGKMRGRRAFAVCTGQVQSDGRAGLQELDIEDHDEKLSTVEPRDP